MKLLDTNVVIYAMTPGSPFRGWARQAIAEAVADDGAAINPVALAELIVNAGPGQVPETYLQHYGVAQVDLPTEAARICSEAYAKYCANRKASGSTAAPKIPLPDFFIGAHAEAMGWPVITNDEGRFKTYFPKVALEQPPRQVAS